MIEKRGGVFIPTCDSCGMELPEEWDFLDAVEAMKYKSWYFVKTEGFWGAWEHYCPECSRQMRSVAFDDTRKGH